jgi:hypothetical protein
LCCASPTRNSHVPSSCFLPSIHILHPVL